MYKPSWPIIATRKTEKAGNPSLEGIVDRRQVPRDQDPEEREPEELVGLELQRIVGNQRRQGREKKHADDAAEKGACRCDPHRRAGTPHLGERITIDRGRRVGRRPRDVEQYGAATAAVDCADVEAHQDHQCRVMLHAVGESGQQRYPHGRGESRQHADGNAEQGSGHNEDQHRGTGKRCERGTDVAESIREVVDETAHGWTPDSGQLNVELAFEQPGDDEGHNNCLQESHGKQPQVGRGARRKARCHCRCHPGERRRATICKITSCGTQLRCKTPFEKQHEGEQEKEGS